MQKTLFIVALALTACASKTKTVATQMEEQSPMEEQQYSPTNLLILVDPAIGKEPLLKAVEEYNAKLLYNYHGFNAVAICKPKDKTIEETIAYFRQVKGVVGVERDEIMHLH